MGVDIKATLWKDLQLETFGHRMWNSRFNVKSASAIILLNGGIDRTYDATRCNAMQCDSRRKSDDQQNHPSGRSRERSLKQAASAIFFQWCKHVESLVRFNAARIEFIFLSVSFLLPSFESY
jgi:hypothetical protein